MDDADTLQVALVRRLAAFLREHGEQILENQQKLSLTAKALIGLTAGFSQISNDDLTTSFDVLPSNRSEIQYHDLHFLYDFVQKTSALKVIHGTSTIQGCVNVATFRNLTCLDIKKVPLHLVEGIQKLRGKLSCIIINRSLNQLQDLFESCGGDQSSPMSWPNLQSASVAYNSLTCLDSSLRLLPTLEVFDLSHNNIVDTERQLEYLTELSWLSIAYNSLVKVPTLSLTACGKLKTLILKNNCLTTLKGLEDLVNLEDMDVSNNCLESHLDLESLRTLHKLRKLFVQGNPLSFHKQHRRLTLGRISPVAAKKMVIDGKAVTPKEVKLCKAVQPLWLPENRSTIPQSEPASSNHVAADVVSEVTTNDDTDTAPLLSSGSNKRGKKSRRARRALISDIADTATETADNSSLDESSLAASYSSRDDYIQIKNKLEQARSQLGPDWLQTLQPNVKRTNEELMRESRKPEVAVTSDPALNINTDPGDAVEIAEVADPQQDDQQFMDTQTAPEAKPRTPEPEAETTSTLWQSLGSVDPEMVKPLLRRTTSETVDAMWRSNKSEEEMEELGPESEPLIVTRKDNPEKELILCVTNRYILEKDINGDVFEKLDLKCLNSAHLVPSDSPSDIQPVIQLTFDYIKKDRRERRYRMEDDFVAVHQFLGLLEPVIKAREDAAKFRDMLQCLKCGEQFKKTEANKVVKRSSQAHNLGSLTSQVTLEEAFSCPKCGGTMLIELEAQAGGRQVVNPLIVLGEPLATSSKANTPLKAGQQDVKSESYLSIPEASALSARSHDFSFRDDQDSTSFYSVQSSLRVGTPNHDQESTLTENVTPTSMFLSVHDSSASSSRSGVQQSNDPEGERIPQTSAHTPRTVSMLKKRWSHSSNESDIVVIKDTATESETVTLKSSVVNVSSQRSVDSEISVISTPSTEVSVRGERSAVGETDMYKPQLDALPETSPCGSLTKNTLNSMVVSMYENSLQVVTDGDQAPIEILDNHFGGTSEGRTTTEKLDVLSSVPPDGMKSTPVSSFKSAESSFKTGGSGVEEETRTDYKNGVAPQSLDRERIWYNMADYTQVDHRLKLHLSMKVFSDEEEFALVLRCAVVRFPKTDELPSLFVASDKVLYIFSITGEELGDTIPKWLKLMYKEAVTEVRYIDIGLGYQSFRVEFGREDACFKIILREESVCKKFIGQLTGIVQNTTFSAESKLGGITKSNPETTSSLVNQVLQPEHNGEEELVDTTLLKFVMCFLHTGELGMSGSQKTSPLSLVVTPSHVCLTSENHIWPRPHCVSASASVMKGQQFSLQDRQKINDIASIELYEDRAKDLKINFFAEEQDEPCQWMITMETEGELLSLLTAVRDPWEQEFGVELQVNTIQSGG